jgi:hypothetical protein
MSVYMSFVTYELSGHPDHDDRAFHELPDRVQEIHDTHAILDDYPPGPLSNLFVTLLDLFGITKYII